MRLAVVLYDGVTSLDAIGPYEVLSRMPGAEVYTVAPEGGPVQAQHGLQILSDYSFAEAPPSDLLLVAGGPGQLQHMEEPEFLSFLRQQAETARWVSAVCTGSLLLGAAGLLRGYRATTHWRYLDCLRDLGAFPVRKRVIADRNRITGAGVSAGIDMGLFLAALIAGEEVAQQIQLQMEYDPQPPFRSGSPEHADADILDAVEAATEPVLQQRRAQTRRIAAQWQSTQH